MPNFASEVAGISLDFEAIPDLQPKAIRGILRVQFVVFLEFSVYLKKTF